MSFISPFILFYYLYPPSLIKKKLKQSLGGPKKKQKQKKKKQKTKKKSSRENVVMTSPYERPASVQTLGEGERRLNAISRVLSYTFWSHSHIQIRLNQN